MSIVAKEEQRKLLEYYKNNLERINYKSFRNQGLMIGSGPIEAAHRTVAIRRRGSNPNETQWTTMDAQRSTGYAEFKGYPPK